MHVACVPLADSAPPSLPVLLPFLPPPCLASRCRFTGQPDCQAPVLVSKTLTTEHATEREEQGGEDPLYTCTHTHHITSHTSHCTYTLTLTNTTHHITHTCCHSHDSVYVRIASTALAHMHICTNSTYELVYVFLMCMHC